MQKVIIAALTLGLLVSCKKFDGLDVHLKEDKLYFSSEKILSTCNKSLLISDFSVNYSNKQEESIAWQIAKDDFPQKDNRQIDFPLLYGSKIEGVSTRSPAIKLEIGKYSYAGTIYCLDDNEETGYDILGKFAISKDWKIKTP